ncbi:MAG: bifunctional serine/threonine-protein kinase/formylglycine-generating enzyme family protein [Planctomycetota bacterium]
MTDFPDRSEPSVSPAAEEAFAQYLQRIDRGEQLSFAEFVAQHHDIAADLDCLQRHWQAVKRLLARPAHESLADLLARHFGPQVNPSVTLEAEGKSAGNLLERLARRGQPFGRYRIKDEIGHGGMGVVLRVWDEDLRRHLAMKLVKEAPAAERVPGHERDQELAKLYRFLEEAQITSQLDHPGIVSVHEIGLAPEGLVYFTMKLVRGEDLESIYKLVARRESGWNSTRLLTVLLKACEALAYAHDRGVIHRDLKPSNIMVGRYGEVYVMDWGLARILGREDRKDLRVRPQESATSVQSERKDRTESDPNSPLYTIDGKPLGTPMYMPPEQAAGRLDEIGPWSDVYAIGAMLYQLLGGRRPYVRPTERVDGYTVLQRVLAGPPERIAALAPRAAPELVAICEKAMARSPHDRYATTAALADDLRAYLEGRVVRAHRTGPIVELTKWVRRNQAVAALLAALIMMLLTGSIVVAGVQRRKSIVERDARVAAERNLFERSVVLAVARADELWPVHPDRAKAMREWLDEARRLIEKEPQYRAELGELRRRGRAIDAEPRRDRERERVSDRLKHQREMLNAMQVNLGRARRDSSEEASGNAAVLEHEIPFLESEIRDLELDLAALQPWEFADAHDRDEDVRLATVTRHLEQLSRPGTGLIAQVAERLNQAETLTERSLGGAAARAWDDAISAIADVQQCPVYEGLTIDPELGLVPLRLNPDTGLWEFWHVLSGKRPSPRNRSDWIIAPETGLVLILMPRKRYTLGASNKAGAAHYDRQASSFAEWPVRDLELEPYFLSRYELTQGQWRTATGHLACRCPAGSLANQQQRCVSATHPVESVSWADCDSVLWRWGLELPTESQWEAAARAQTSTPFWWGTEIAAPPRLNFYDRGAARADGGGNGPAVDDGCIIHGPVDAFPGNRFGFQGILGNVWEWCRDWFVAGDQRTYEPETGECVAELRQIKTLRGGSFRSVAFECRVTYRRAQDVKYVEWDVGVRPACRIVQSR